MSPIKQKPKHSRKENASVIAKRYFNISIISMHNRTFTSENFYTRKEDITFLRVMLKKSINMATYLMRKLQYLNNAFQNLHMNGISVIIYTPLADKVEHFRLERVMCFN